MPEVLLVPSPLLGPVSWQPVAEELRDDGHDAAVVDTSAVQAPLQLVEAVQRAAHGDRVVLVPHSNAGLAVPALGDRIDHAGTVFVDAALPPATGTTAMAPAALLTMLRGLADEHGVLPPWTEWWEDLTGVFPDAGARAAIEADQPRLPLSYFTSRLPVPDGWTDRPSAYLAFAETYAEERAFALACGWPTATLEGRHLHQLHDPPGVAAAILDLLARIRA